MWYISYTKLNTYGPISRVYEWTVTEKTPLQFSKDNISVKAVVLYAYKLSDDELARHLEESE